MSSLGSQRGFLLVVAVVLVVVVAAFIAVLGSMVSSDVKSSADTQGSVQAFYLSGSGLEFEQRRWAQNLNWYRSATDPNPSSAAAQALGAGSFTAYSNFPATLLKTKVSTTDTTITVYSTDRFPASGTLQIEEDVLAGTGEFVTYTGISGNRFTGLTRNVAVGGGSNPAGAQLHSRSDAVYPVTTLATNLPNNCNTISKISIVSHTKFLGAGTLDINGEEISYSHSSASGSNLDLTGVTRCLGVVGPALHAVGQPVTPVLIGGDSADYQVEIVSTGTVGGSVRYARKTVQRCVGGC